MEKFTLRWSKARDMYFVEPSRGRNVRGFWLFAEKHEFPVPPEIIKNPYSGAMAFDGYWRQWFSMRGFIVQQSDPQSGVPANAELVRDYLMPAHLVTLEEAVQVAETNRIEAEAAAKEAQETAQRAEMDAAVERSAAADRAAEEREAAAQAAVREAEEALAAVEKEAQEKAARESAGGDAAEEPNPRPLPEREGEQELKESPSDSESAATTEPAPDTAHPVATGRRKRH
jgi:flagellar biosynthesis GTPase FlhF